MREFFRGLARNLESGRPAVLVTVLSAGGSTPRGAGAMLAVFPGGGSAGSIGGGNVEYEAQRLSASLLQSGENALREFRFRQGEDTSLGMVCGGDVRLHFQYLRPGDAGLFRLLEAKCAENTGVWLSRRFDGSAVEESKVLTSESRPVPPPVPSWEEGGWFTVPVSKPGRVYVFGGGHVAQALVPLLAGLGFRVTVYDDRPEYASRERFPQAEETVCAPFPALHEHLTFTPDDYVVIMTRGHQADYEVLTQVLRSELKYLGCIGSQRKLALCKERLLLDGFQEKDFLHLHAPIGLSIGAETPQEIAVSIAAEMIAIRSGFTPK